MKPLFQHRQYVLIASVIAALPSDIRNEVAIAFANDLQRTNPNYDRGRFLDAALGNPQTRKDQPR